MTTLEDLHRAADAAWPDPTPRLVLSDWYEERGDRVEAALQRVLAEPASDARRIEYADAMDRGYTEPCPSCRGTGGRVIGGSWRDRFTCSKCGGVGKVSVPCPRAEFVRVQVELAGRRRLFEGGGCIHPDSAAVTQGHYDRHPCGCADCKLVSRERELWDQGEWEDWKRLPGNAFNTLDMEFVPFTVVTLPVTHWSRGFVAKVTLPWKSWREHGPGIVRRHPVTRVELAGNAPLRWRPDSGSSSFDHDERFSWINGARQKVIGDLTRQAATVPGEVFADLKKLPNRGVRYDEYVRYDTQELALDALSRACLAWAWGQATSPAA
jgi:hypothetical protein